MEQSGGIFLFLYSFVIAALGLLVILGYVIWFFLKSVYLFVKKIIKIIFARKQIDN